MDVNDRLEDMLLSEEPNPPYRPHEPLSKRERLYWLSVLTALCGIFVLWTAASSRSYGQISSSPSTILRSPCGSNPQEAIARGCEFDSMAFLWLPKECQDRELTEEFRKMGSWTLYADVNKTRVMSEEEFSQDTRLAWLTNEIHIAHCIFSWTKMHRAMAKGRMVNAQMPLAHSHHYMNNWKSIGNPEDIEVHAIVRYPDCGYFTDCFPGLDYPKQPSVGRRV